MSKALRLRSLQALKLQRGMGMKRITAVFLAALSVAVSGCGLEADEYVDENGNVQKHSQKTQALAGDEPATPDATGGEGEPLPALQFVPPLVAPTGGGSDPVVNPRNPDLVALPQDPIPLVEPGKTGPQPNGPRVGPGL